jgi:hypothetical protein
MRDRFALRLRRPLERDVMRFVFALSGNMIGIPIFGSVMIL